MHVYMHVYRGFSNGRYRVPRLFNCVPVCTVCVQLGATAYRVFSAGHYRVPRLFAVALPRYRVHAGIPPLPAYCKSCNNQFV